MPDASFSEWVHQFQAVYPHNLELYILTADSRKIILRYHAMMMSPQAAKNYTGLETNVGQVHNRQN